MNNDIEKTNLLFQMLGYELQDKEIPPSTKLVTYPKYQELKGMLNIVAYDERFMDVEQELYRLEHLSERLLSKTLKRIDELHQQFLTLQYINPFFYDTKSKVFNVNKVHELRVYQQNQSTSIQAVLEAESLTNAQRYDHIMQEVECWKASAKVLLQIRKGEYQQLCNHVKEQPKVDRFLAIFVIIVTTLSGVSLGVLTLLPNLEGLETTLQSIFLIQGRTLIYLLLILGPIVSIFLLVIVYTIRPRVLHQLEKRYGRYLQGKMCVSHKLDSFSDAIQHSLSHRKKLNQRIEKYSIVQELQPIASTIITRIEKGIYQYRPYQAIRWLILVITIINLSLQTMVLLAWLG